MHPRTVLLTGFEPFADEPENASERAVALLAAGWEDPTIRLVTGRLPVAYGQCGTALAALLVEHRPDAVVAVGEAGGRRVVTPERWARNRDDARIPDNAGAQPRGARIDDGPRMLATRLDVAAIVAACAADAIPAEVSEDAGGFVCNHLFRRLLTLTDVPAGFVHVPAVRRTGVAGVGAETDPGAAEQGAPGLTLAQCARALGHAVRLAASGARAGSAPAPRPR